MTWVLIASPVRQRHEILAEFLLSLRELDLRGISVEFAFVDDNDDPESSELLRRFDPGAPVRFLPPAPPAEAYQTDDRTHHWVPELMNRVGEYKDRFLEIGRDEGFDAVFLVDSDLVLHPRTLIRLVEHELAVCAEIFWTRWEPDGPELPQVWLHGQYSLFPLGRNESISEAEMVRRTSQFLELLRQPGVHEVGGLGACTLVRREAIVQGVAFRVIPNLALVGEDRDFCVRAAALGIPLFVDTHFPALHLYRLSDLDRVAAFKAANRGQTVADWRKASGNKVVLSMVVRNESGRFLDTVLRHAASYVDAAVIIDDASTDDTVAICRAALGDLPHEIVALEKSLFHEEHKVRRLQWRQTMAAHPDWILNLDADEIFEDSIREHLRSLVDQTDVDAISFRLYDMWNETQYREENSWTAHHLFRPFLVRPTPSTVENWSDHDQHAGRFPPSVEHLSQWTCVIRLKHLGWMRETDRRAKYERYRLLDPDGSWGSKNQYESILDLHPTLVDWDS